MAKKKILPGTCPTGCGRRVERGAVLCNVCVMSVPKSTLKQLEEAWKALKRSKGGTAPQAVYQAAYAAVVKAATP